MRRMMEERRQRPLVLPMRSTVASATSGRAVLISRLHVMAAMAGMFLLGQPDLLVLGASAPSRRRTSRCSAP